MAQKQACINIHNMSQNTRKESFLPRLPAAVGQSSAAAGLSGRFPGAPSPPPGTGPGRPRLLPGPGPSAALCSPWVQWNVFDCVAVPSLSLVSGPVTHSATTLLYHGPCLCARVSRRKGITIKSLQMHFRAALSANGRPEASSFEGLTDLKAI